MQAFQYKGFDVEGNKVAGELVAETIEEVERKMAAQEVTIIAILPVERRKRSRDASTISTRTGRRVASDADAAHILENLAIMAETGVPLVEAIEAVTASARTPKIAEQLERMKLEIVAGASLSNAFRGASGIFPIIVADMVKVAEEGGRLDKALRSSAVYVERSADLRKRIVNAMIYPAVMVAVSIITLGVLVVFVLPRFKQIFMGMGTDMPITTRLLLEVGDLVRGHPWPTLIGLVGAAFGVKYLLGVPKVGEALGRFALKLPMVGPLMRNLAFARAFQSIGTLLGSNVSLISALEHGGKVAGVSQVRNALNSAKEAVEHGQPLSNALRDTKVFPATLVQMVAVGERTGRLALLLNAWSAGLENEVDSRLKALTAIVEPAMVVVMGIVIGTITVSIIAPIYSVVENIK